MPDASTLLTSMIASIVTAYITAQFALKRYRHEKWWDFKAESYKELVSALTSVIEFCDTLLEESLGETKTSKDTKHKSENRYATSLRTVQKHINIGKLFISDDAYNDLLALDRNLFKAKQEGDLLKQRAEIRGAAESCLESLINHARNDLKVCSTFRFFSSIFKRA